jgi:hypothetical protein
VAIDQTKLGQLVSEQMAAIEEHLSDAEGDWQIGNCCTVVEVRGSQGQAMVRCRFSAGSPAAVLGLAEYCKIQARNMVGNQSRGDS